METPAIESFLIKLQARKLITETILYLFCKKIVPRNFIKFTWKHLR